MNNPEQLLAENGFYAATVHGHSMEPLLFEHRDVVYIEPTTTYKPWDVVLFRRTDGQLVLHRLIRCKNGVFWLCGDNDLKAESVDPKQMLGVMTAFSRNGQTVRVTSRRYRLYSRIWNFSLPTKRVLRWLCHFRRRTP